TGSLCCISSYQSLMPIEAWWVVQSTAPSWLRTMPSCGPSCSLYAITTELTFMAQTPDDPGRMQSSCWMG
ncbi:hypothetical protein XENOCAPTIV_014121, partial [Xenoophorus captivus]